MRNEALAAAMKEFAFEQAELAEELNKLIDNTTGEPGTLTDRHVRRWLKGQSKWPHTRQRQALEAVFGRTVEELGFTPRVRRPRPAPEEDSLRRRTFVASATAMTTTTLVSGAAGATRRTSVGMADVERLRTRLDALADEDNHRGSGTALERRAVALARHTVALQENMSASQRVRGHLYAVASEFMTWALWAAIDDRQPERAQWHMDRAVSLAGMSGDSAVMWRAWNQGSMGSSQLERYADALAAAEAARACSVARRDPLRASLTHARAAGVHAKTSDRAATLRSLGHAWTMLERWSPHEARPAWLEFYDAAELSGLSGMAHLRLGNGAEAEAHMHRALSMLKPEFERNRVYYTVALARTQSAQGDLEHACATAATVMTASVPMPGRTRNNLVLFNKELLSVARGARVAREWVEQVRDTHI